MPDVSADAMSAPRRFAPGWQLWLFTLVFLPVLLSLGVWQLDRAEQKRQLQAHMDQQQQRPAIPLSAVQPSTELAWHPLQLTGQFDPERIWLLDNRTRNGQAGVEVLQLFHDQPSGLQLVVNRGWVAWPDRRQLPEVPTSEGNLQLQVEALPDPESGFRLHSTSEAGWPRLIAHVDPPALADQAALPLQPWIARLLPGSPGALRLEWPAMPMSASKHTGYAVQWFALATALLILFIWAGYKGHNNNDKHH